MRELDAVLREIDNGIFHPLCLEYPLPPEKELIAMAMDIQKYGLREKIKRLNGKRLDGRTRTIAGKMVNYKFTKEDFIDLPPDTNPGAYTISMNIIRRHIESPAHRIELVLKALEFDKELKNENEIEDENLKKIVKRRENEIIAKEAKSDVITVERARVIIELAKKDPEIKRKWEKAKQSQVRISIKKIHEEHVKAHRKNKEKTLKTPKAPTKVELRQELMDTKEEVETIKIKKEAIEYLYKKVIEIAKELGSWDAIEAKLRPQIEKKKTPFPTIKQLREAELL